MCQCKAMVQKMDNSERHPVVCWWLRVYTKAKDVVSVSKMDLEGFLRSEFRVGLLSLEKNLQDLHCLEKVAAHARVGAAKIPDAGAVGLEMVESTWKSAGLSI